MKKTTLALALFLIFMTVGVAQNQQFFTVPDRDFEYVFEIKAFPIPTAERLVVETDFPGSILFRLISMAGQCAKSGKLTGGEIVVEGLPKGLYGLALCSENGRPLATIWLEKQ